MSNKCLKRILLYRCMYSDVFSMAQKGNVYAFRQIESSYSSIISINYECQNTAMHLNGERSPAVPQTSIHWKEKQSCGNAKCVGNRVDYWRSIQVIWVKFRGIHWISMRNNDVLHMVDGKQQLSTHFSRKSSYR